MADPAPADPTDPDAPRSGPISPDDEANAAAAASQAATQQRAQAQAAFDTLRRTRAFTTALLSSGGKKDAVQKAFQQSGLGQGLSGLPPAQQ